MLRPLIRRDRKRAGNSNERGVTLALVAVAMVSIIAMAALSIDIGTLYEAKAEAQRSADAAALAAARTISISGITGDPATGGADGSWANICGGATSLATMTAIKVAQQNLIAGVAIPSGGVTVTYGMGPAGGSRADCSGLTTNFAVNPIVTVKVQRTNLPVFFARVFSLFGSNFAGGGVSATASAEAFNPSGSGLVATAGTIPVSPRCVKPWIIPNVDPTAAGGPFVNTLDGSIVRAGVSQLGGGVIGESFTLTADCVAAAPNCLPPAQSAGGNMLLNPPASSGGTIHYVPASVLTNAGAAPSCAAANDFSRSIVGCDQSTVYACGTVGGAAADLNENPINPVGGGDTFTAVQCLTHSATGGEDGLNTTAFPFQIQAGFDNPLVRNGLVFDTDVITTSSSIVTLPIYDNGPGAPLAGVANPPVTIVGFLQVFIGNAPPVALDGSMNVTVLNVAGCSNAAANAPVSGTSPVPVRLITPP